MLLSLILCYYRRTLVIAQPTDIAGRKQNNKKPLGIYNFKQSLKVFVY
jgi:hypothetical protein